MGILDGFIGLAELTQGMGKARINVWGNQDKGRIRKYLRKHGIKASCEASPEGTVVCVPKKNKIRAFNLLKKRKEAR